MRRPVNYQLVSVYIPYIYEVDLGTADAGQTTPYVATRMVKLQVIR